MVMMYTVFVMTVTPVWTAGHLGADIQAALGMAVQCSLFLSVVCMAISSGATAAITQSLGALRVRRAHRYIATTILLSLALGLLMGAAGFVFAGAILGALHVPGSIRPVATEIWQIYMIGLPFSYVYNATGVVFRATRQVIPPLVVALLVTAAHAAICIGTGFGLAGFPDWGYRGIAWAAVAAPLLGAVLNCLLLCRSGHFTARDLPSPRWLARGLPYLVRVAVPAGLASLVWQSGYLVIFVLVATAPTESVAALAGLTAGQRIEAFLFMPGMAFHMTAAILVGNCLGAGNRAEARRVAKILVASAAGLMSLMAIAMWPFRGDLAAILSTDATTCRYIVAYLFYNLISTPFSIGSQVLGGVMVGAGATRFNLLVFGGTFWVLRIPLGYLLCHHLWLDASGVFCAMLVSQIVQTLTMLLVFGRLDWMRFAMRSAVHHPAGGHGGHA